MTDDAIGIAASSGNRAQPASQRPGLDLYESPVAVVRALRAEVRLPREIWEPCAGRGAISNCLRRLGHRVAAYDLEDYGVDGIETGWDFLKDVPPDVPGTIVSNPPYKWTQEFLERGLVVAETSYWLLRLAVVKNSDYREIMRHLTGYWPLSPRPPRMHRDGWEGETSAATNDFAWYRFSRQRRIGPADFWTIYWRDHE